MKEIINYPIYSFEKPILIPKELEEVKTVLMIMFEARKKNCCNKSGSSRINGLFLKHFTAIQKSNSNATLQLKIMSENYLELEIIYEDKEGEFIKKLKEYNDFCRKHDTEEILAFAEKTNKKRRQEIREGRKINFMYQRKNTLSDDAFDLNFSLWQYYTPNIKNYICLIEYTDDNKGIKVTYKIE